MGYMSEIPDPGDRSGTAVVWFRRDLRLHDHPALSDAVHGAQRIAPLFVLDEALLRGRWPAPNRVWFMRESALLLDRALRAHGSRLHIRCGRPQEVVPAFAREVGAERVLASRDYGPYARRRDRAVAAALRAGGTGLHVRRGLVVHEPEELRTAAGGPFRVFSPYKRAWDALPRRPVRDVPEGLERTADAVPGAMPTLADLHVPPPTADLLAPGEDAARDRLERWVTGGLERYAELRDRLGTDGTSRLSQDLHWGLLSAGEVVARTDGPTRSQQRFVAELCWRDFYTAVLFAHPQVTSGAFQPDLDRLPTLDDDEALDAWKTGRTGFPVVDAAMRQLVACGWMHNRARMIAASFLAKDLLLDRRLGERHFMAHLVDGDLANNNGGWQWAAGSGTDAQPFVRVFNPVLQGQRFDPDGAYVRRWVPELRLVPDAHLHEPWTMPGAVQRASRCVIGRDYPEPIVDHAHARRRALAAYATVAATRA